MRDGATQQRSRLSWLALSAAALAAIVTMIALVSMLMGATRARDVALRQQESSSERVIAAATFAATMARAEAALGRFVISGDRALGGVYSDGWRSSGNQLDQLAKITRDPAAQVARIEAMRGAWQARGQELADAAIRTTYRQNSEALATYYRIRTSPALDTLTATVEAYVARERFVLALRSRRVDAAVARTNRLTTAISIVGVLLVSGIGALAFVVLGAAQRRRREDERAAALEDAVAERTLELTESNERLVAEMATREVAEARLRQAQKMDAVGKLTGGVAHDFNNMLAVILGGVEMAKRRLADGDGDPGRHLDSALEGAQRAAALTKRLLAFARAEPLLPVAVDPDALISGMSDMLDRTLGERVIVRHIVHGGGWPIHVDRNQLENAILNLAVNARDAMPDGGTLTIATAGVTLRDGEIAELAGGDYVRIAVSDTGTGIDQAVIDRIFEPFFTTKPSSDGTGLGLSQVFGSVRQSGGAMTVDSAVGIGTTISIYLPRHDGDVLAPDFQRPEVADRTATAKLLVVEDDRRVLAATCDALTELGHNVVPCTDGDAAERALGEHDDIDLIVSDVLMPGLTGPELVARLRVRRPGLRALFVTGYAGETIDARAFGSDIVLRKPFTIAALSHAVAAALDETPPLESRAAA